MLGESALGESMGGSLGGGHVGSFGDDHLRGHSLGREHQGKGPKGYRRSDDRIKEDVCEELTHHGDLDASEIEVEVLDGAVTLTGSVCCRWAKRCAEDCLDQVSGIVDIHNRLRVVEPRSA